MIPTYENESNFGIYKDRFVFVSNRKTLYERICDNCGEMYVTTCKRSSICDKQCKSVARRRSYSLRQYLSCNKKMKYNLKNFNGSVLETLKLTNSNAMDDLNLNEMKNVQEALDSLKTTVEIDVSEVDNKFSSIIEYIANYLKKNNLWACKFISFENNTIKYLVQRYE